GDKAQMALDRIRAIANPVVPKEGERYYGTVVKTADFGAFVSLTPGSDGLLHISKLGGSKRLNHADEALTVGDKMWVEVTQVKDGRKFSLDLVEGPGGEDVSAEPDTPAQGAAAPEAPVQAGEPGLPAEEAHSGPAPVRRERTRTRTRGGEGRGERSRERSGGHDGDDEREGGRRRRRRRP